MATDALLPEIDTRIAKDLACETEHVLAMAEAALPFERDHPLMRPGHSGETCLKARLTDARRTASFIDDSVRRPISLSAILSAQQRVAHAHGLGYLSARQQSRWVPLPDARASQSAGRSRNYLSVVLNDPGRGFPRLDWTLIGHAFGMPSAVWEADDTTYQRWRAEAADGALLFARGLAFLDQFAGRGGLIRVRQPGKRTPLTVVSSNARQIGAGGEPGVQRVRQGDRVSLQLSFPPDFSPPPGARTEALILERDALGQTCLVTRAPLVADDLSCEDGGEFPHETPDVKPYIYFATPGTSTLYAVLCSSPGLARLDFYTRTRRETLGQPALQPLLTGADLADMRQHVLGCDPARWALIRTRVEIAA